MSSLMRRWGILILRLLKWRPLSEVEERDIGKQISAHLKSGDYGRCKLPR